MAAQSIFNPASLTKNGLNLHAVFDIKLLPQDVKKKLAENYSSQKKFTQLILIGNGGSLFWRSLKKSKGISKEPVDDFALSLVNNWLRSLTSDIKSKIIYPPSCTLDLQELGQLAGWHHPSPFMVGINQEWGSWFAYRAIILANSDFATQPPLEAAIPPCISCTEKPCIAHCPGQAVTLNSFLLNDCIDYRKQKNSSCQTSCQSRLSCPVAPEHRYTEEQIHYHYSRSLRTIMKQT